jgi:hypothetical protein
MLEKKKSKFAKYLTCLINGVIILWTLYLFFFIIFNEIYKDKINCKEKNLDDCDTNAWYITIYNFHPFNFNNYGLPGKSTIGGYINIAFILFIIILSCILLFTSNTTITLSYKKISFLIITIICLIYHMIYWVSSF